MAIWNDVENYINSDLSNPLNSLIGTSANGDTVHDKMNDIVATINAKEIMNTITTESSTPLNEMLGKSSDGKSINTKISEIINKLNE